MLNHTSPYDIIRLERCSLSSSLKKCDSKCLPCDRVPRKGHEEDLDKELIVECLLAKFTVLHDDEIEVCVEVFPISILLFKHADFGVESGESSVDIHMLGLQCVLDLLCSCLVLDVLELFRLN